MKISHHWLQTYFDAKIPTAEKLAELFPFHFSEVESMEKVGDDTIFDIKILPDRAHYALCHQGIAGEISALTQIPIKNRFEDEIKADTNEKISIKIIDTNFCRRMVSRVIEIPEMGKSPEWLRAALEVVGQRSINPIVDLTNYVMLDIGQPLHAFDADKLEGDLVVRLAQEGEKLTLLNDKELTLTSSDGVIADTLGPLDIAGIKGGKRAEISTSTKRIFMVSDTFHPAAIRKTSTKYDSRNEASKRFENEITPEMAIHGMNNVSALIKEFFPDAKFGSIFDDYPNPVQPKIITAKISDITRTIGVEISDSEIVAILKRLGMKVAQKGDILTITVPPTRLDISDWRDLPEEVGRMYGYDRIKPNTPPISTTKQKVEKTFYYAEKIKNVLVETGFSEVYTYSLVAKGFQVIEKPLAADKNHLRANITDGITKSLELNARNADLLGLETINVFEIGKVFTEKGEHTSLCIGIKNVKKAKGADQAKEKIKKVRDEVLKSLEADARILCTVDDSGGLVTVAGETIGMTNNSDGIFEINLDKLVATLPDPVSYGDLHFGKAASIEYKKFSLYPFITRDIAVFVQGPTLYDEVWQAIEKGIVDANATNLLVRHSLFDTFKKEGKVSYAFRMVFQSMEKTLTDDEANAIMEKVYSEMKKKGWEVR